MTIIKKSFKKYDNKKRNHFKNFSAQIQRN